MLLPILLNYLIEYNKFFHVQDAPKSYFNRGIRFMKFIVSTFNPTKMVIEDNFDLKVHKLSEEEFLALCYDAYSCVGYEDVALMLNVAHNKEPVKARIGDIILFADMNKGTLEYSCIRICPNEVPLYREDEYLLEEEMI